MENTLKLGKVILWLCLIIPDLIQVDRWNQLHSDSVRLSFVQYDLHFPPTRGECLLLNLGKKIIGS